MVADIGDSTNSQTTFAIKLHFYSLFMHYIILMHYVIFIMNIIIPFFSSKGYK